MNRIIFLLVIMLTALSSCKKYLDKKSNSILIVPATLNDLQGLLDDGMTMNLKRTPCYLETSADDYFLPATTYDALPVLYHDMYNWKPVAYNHGNDWSNSYIPVYNANLCLDLLKNVERTDANAAAWDNVKGSALFFRAYYFLWLAWDYAKTYDEQTADKDPGIVLRLSSDFNVPSVRASVRETYQQIIRDTKESVPLLPDYPQHVLQPSKAAAYALLARICLSMRDYTNAGLYADSCLYIKNDLMDYNGDTDIPGGIGANVPFSQFNKETIFYTEMCSVFAILHLTSYALIDTVLYSSYGVGDLRSQALFKAKSGYYQFKGNYTGTGNIFFSGLAVDEVYLIRAECLARQNKKEAALTDLNTLLKNRYASGNYIPATAATADDALKIILQERRKELLMRGLRWMDIKRLNKEGADIIPARVEDGQVITLPPNADFYALPLPDDIIRTTGIQQN